MKIKYSDIGIKLDLINKSRGQSFDLCFQFVRNLIEDEIDLTLLLETETNHKDELLQQYHKLGWGDPKYNVMEVIIDHNKMGKKYFKMYVRDNDCNIIGTGVGSSKQKGEKLAAKKALQYLKIIPDDNEDIILNNDSNEIYFKDKKNIDKFNNHTNIVHESDTDNNNDTDDSYDNYSSDENNYVNKSSNKLSNNSKTNNKTSNRNNSIKNDNLSIFSNNLTLAENIKLSNTKSDTGDKIQDKPLYKIKTGFDSKDKDKDKDKDIKSFQSNSWTRQSKMLFT